MKNKTYQVKDDIEKLTVAFSFSLLQNDPYYADSMDGALLFNAAHKLAISFNQKFQEIFKEKD